MDVREALMTRHSCRRFKSDPVPMETVRRILEAAGKAPSGHNTQPWKVYVVTGDTRERISQKALEIAGGGTTSL
ncbi:MAG: nitroreductase family protein, partial [Pseudomonadota bacterium]